MYIYVYMYVHATRVCDVVPRYWCVLNMVSDVVLLGRVGGGG